MQWRLTGAMPGDVMPHFVAWIFSTLEASGVVYSHFSNWSAQQELLYHAGCQLFMVFAFPTYTFLSPYTTPFDVQFGVVAIPAAALLYVCFVVYIKTEMGAEMFHLRYLYPVLCIHQLVGFLRYCADPNVPELPVALFTTTFLTAGINRAAEHIEANIIRMQHSLKAEVSRAEAALASSQQSKADLVHLSNGMSSMLKALCDVVFHVDEDLRIDQPTPQLYEFLVGAHGKPSDLQGRPLCEFLQDEQDANLARSMLASKQDDTGSESSNSEGEGGAAGAFNVRIQYAAGCCARVQVFFARLASQKILLGLRTEAGEPSPHEPRPDISDQSPSQTETARHGKAEEEGNTTNVNGVDDYECQKPNPSRLAIRFDAGSDHFTVDGLNPCFGGFSSMRMRPQALLPWVAPQERKAFEDWVVQSVQNAPWDQPSVTECFGEPLTMTLPKVKARQVVASKVWLETSPQDDEGDIWATLWLEGFVVQHTKASKNASWSSPGFHLPTVTEEDGVSELAEYESDTSSSFSMGTGSSFSVDM
eukprot:CAMPEP_0206482122 /NCGR_PEP_ID=MMETSP0324_2-20121206/38666_1 /ASSEMBLY_ACC=CAM_ASM_000836 /TAXON_ID=2866 /ORGANISM="Crypthecodinium cohnii, Strain Seligo" /LENGTH=531 /DNA_ID=CAMNT_0053959969 /DNA_START=361 /DNA_END=1956 /DNA_ORIENTATION=+